MKRFSILMIFTLLFAFSISSCSKEVLNGDKNIKKLKPKNELQNSKKVTFEEYQELWRKVEENRLKPKSALKDVEKIYEMASSDENNSQMIKALIYKIKFLKKVKEDELVEARNLILNEIKISNSPKKEILHSILAEVYWSYYQQNRYRFLHRSKISEKSKIYDSDMKTWDLSKIIKEIQNQFSLSLENGYLLKDTSIEDYSDILTERPDTRSLRPTLYDFLIARAINFYENSESGLIKPVDYFKIDNNKYFSNTADFLAIDIKTKDINDFKYLAVKYYQEWLKSHLNDETPNIIIDIELNRLKFIYNNIILDDKENLYMTSLKNMLEYYKKTNSKMLSEIKYQMAYLKYDLSKKYNIKNGKKYKNYKKEALEICSTLKNENSTLFAQNYCESLKEAILMPYLNFVTKETQPSNKAFNGLLTYKNINKLYVKIIKTNFKEYEDNKGNTKDMIIKLLNEKKDVKSYIFDLPDEKDFNINTLELPLKGLKSGKYLIAFSNSPKFEDTLNKNELFSYSVIDITNIGFFEKASHNFYEYYFKNLQTGKVLPNVEVTLYDRSWNRTRSKHIFKKIRTLKSDKNGYLKIDEKETYYSRYVEFKHKKDVYFPQKNFHFYRYYQNKHRFSKTVYFTDRKIYRPGQTVYFKALSLYVDHGDKAQNKILKNRKMNFELYDVNHQKISSLTLVSNEFGTVSGEFQLPQNILTGNYYIRNEDDSEYFSVEEYKRPKFQVEFKPSKKEYKLNEIIKIDGVAKALAGFKIDGAKVSYRVLNSKKIEIKNGTTKTDENGDFSIKFKAISDLDKNDERKPAHRFIIYASVTDVNGETRTIQKTIVIGTTSLVLDIQTEDKVDLANKNYDFKINSKNLSGDFLASKGKVNIYRLKSPKTYYIKKPWGSGTPSQFLMKKESYEKMFPHNAYKNEDDFKTWKKEKLVFSSNFNTKKSKNISLKSINKWKSGKYVIEASSKDSKGNDIKDVKYVTFYNSKSRRLAYPQIFTLDEVKSYKNIKKPISFLIGSSDNIEVKYNIIQNGDIIKSKVIKLNNNQKKIIIPLKESYRGGFYLNFAFIKGGFVYTKSKFVKIPWDNKELKITYETFRDKLLPASQEEWILKISGKHKDRVIAEMVATMYDASLDAFIEHDWTYPFYSYYQSNIPFKGKNDISNSINQRFYSYFYNVSEIIKYYDSLNWFGINMPLFRIMHYGVRGSYHSFKGRPLAKSMKKIDFEEEASEIEQKEVSSISSDKELKRKDKINENNKDTKPQIRRNFKETAFFYPNLKTDKEGNIYIKFTMPDSLTKWKFLGFAHTKDLKHAFTSKEIITQKNLMVNSFAPRFLREGDSIIFTSKITSLKDEILKGNVKLLLFDAITMKPIDSYFDNKTLQKDFEIKPKQSVKVAWKIKIPENIHAVTYRIVAKSGVFSDAEEMTIPILSNRMLVTESMPLPLKGKETKTFEFKKLKDNKSKTLKNHKLTLEFTSNPIWYAVQALPYLIEYPYECMEQTFSRFYANSLSSFIIKKNPKIKRVFDIWKTSQEGALKSNLEKNQELKSLILKETPWVRDAYSESEQKKRIALLFDFNNMSNSLNRALEKLKDGQMPSGAWPWFKGGRENRYITQYIVSGFSRLNNLDVISLNKSSIRNMITNALAYLDREIQTDYENLIKSQVKLKNENLTYTIIHYLYARSYLNSMFKLPKTSQRAYDYFLNQEKTYWGKFSNYTKAMIALTLNRHKEKKIANEIMDSIKEHLISNDEMGLYLKESYGYFWYNAPIETHALLIEAFDEVKNDKKTVEGLKTWLLKSKQTQSWNTTKATTNAIYALLLKGNDWLNQSQLAEITIGDEKINYEDENLKVQAGSGYLKKSWNKTEIKPNMSKVTVINKNDSPAWGGVYWQYFENLDKITFSKTPLSLERSYFVEKTTNKGIELVSIDKTKIKVGDKIKVRIILKADRDMEFIHLKDMRSSNLEPIETISRYHYQDGLSYYQSIKDASVDFFFDYLKKGTYVFEYSLYVTHSGDFSTGISTIQSMYAPEFSSHSNGQRIIVE